MRNYRVPLRVLFAGAAFAVSTVVPTGSPLSSRSPAVVLRPSGVGAVMFGSAQPVASRSLRDLLGQGQGPTPLPGDSRCGVDAVATWAHIQVFFFKNRFVGYNTGYSKKPLAGFITDRGLRVGDTVATARNLYGHRFVVSAAQGGSWHTGPGSVYGYLVNPPAFGPADRIAGIAAGHVGCPAMTP